MYKNKPDKLLQPQKKTYEGKYIDCSFSTISTNIACQGFKIMMWDDIIFCSLLATFEASIIFSSSCGNWFEHETKLS